VKGALLPPAAESCQAEMQSCASRSKLNAVESLKRIVCTRGWQHAACRTASNRGHAVLSRRALLVAALMVVSSCMSPTLPLPPPNQPDVEGPDATGNVTLSGSVIPGANVYANNLDTRKSAGSKSDSQTGAYRFQIAATIGAQLEFFYIYDSVTSDRIRFTVADPMAVTNTIPDSGTIYAVVDAGVESPR
jgi:hypothetical protein